VAGFPTWQSKRSSGLMLRILHISYIFYVNEVFSS
jgi:hypothetical protein